MRVVDRSFHNVSQKSVKSCVLSILMQGVISLSDATAYENRMIFFWI